MNSRLAQVQAKQGSRTERGKWTWAPTTDQEATCNWFLLTKETLVPSDGFSLHSVLTTCQGRSHAQECLANRKGSQWWLYRHLSRISLSIFFCLIGLSLVYFGFHFLCVFVGFGVYVCFLFFVCLNIGWKDMGLGRWNESGRSWGEGKVWSEYNMKFFCKNQNKIVLSFIPFQTLVPKPIT